MAAPAPAATTAAAPVPHAAAPPPPAVPHAGTAGAAAGGSGQKNGGFSLHKSTVAVQGPAAAAAASGKRLEYVIIDTAAFIRGVRLEGMADVRAVPSLPLHGACTAHTQRAVARRLLLCHACSTIAPSPR